MFVHQLSCPNCSQTELEASANILKSKSLPALRSGVKSTFLFRVS